MPKSSASTCIPTAVQHKPHAVTATLTLPTHKQSQLDPLCSRTTPSPSLSVSSLLLHWPKKSTPAIAPRFKDTITHLLSRTDGDHSPSPSDSENLCTPSPENSSIDSDEDSISDMDVPSLECDSMPPMYPTDPDPHLMYEAENCEKLSFPNLPRLWYVKEQRFYNVARDTLRRARPIERDSANAITSMNRSTVQGSLESNLETVRQKLTHTCSTTKACHYKAICEVANLILLHGPLVKTQEAGMVYLRCKGLDTRKRSCEYYEMFSRHLNLIQVYIFDTGYLLPNTGSKIESFIDAIKSTVNKEDILHKAVSDRLNGLVQSSLEYMDTHRDRQVLKSLLAELTSVKFAAKLQGLHSRQGTASAKRALVPNLQKYADIKKTSQLVRSDLTTLQQHRLTQRIISSRKLKEIRTIAEGRGRKLKSTEFPELGLALEYAFGELDTQKGGGGLEAHPRLTTGTLYRGVGNATTMQHAREILLSMAPRGFSISLSSCYNYTENYRQGSAQARRHHSGQGVNAALSLKKPPRTGVQELVVNLHWSTCNVNCIIDRCQKHPPSLVVSKDAKAVIMADIAPVQLPGPSWKKRELPDHSWDQSRTYAITPMTFLFLETKVTDATPSNQDTVVHITRTGQGVTLLNLSFFEPESTFKCMNEILLLLANPALDHFFRDRVTGGLKKELTFVVDNGPQEKPSNPLVQMCMARLLKLLKLHRICQISFAEYHSKRNFVERVHAEENRVLSKHGPFNSHEVHHRPVTVVGSTDHRDNMEHMADEVLKCLQTATFGGNPLLCYRGIKQKDFLFDDEESLHAF